MANTWFRLYAEFANDPKVQMMSEADQRRYIMLLCLRCNGDVTLQDEEVAFQLRISNEEWARTKSLFVSKNLINEDNQPTSWDKRQFASDSSAERVARHRANKKQPCNVTVTPPEADTDTEVNPSLSTGASDPPVSAPATRKGEVCGLLRKAGMSDAAPHYLTDDAWASILAKRTNEEIIEVAKAKMAAMPNQRIGLKYIAPALLDDPKPIEERARGSPAVLSGRQARIDNYAAQAAAARGDYGNEHGNGRTERDITGEAVRVA